MNDEIKEILDYLKDDKWDYYPSDGIPYKVFLMEERDKLLDYITNLQEELEIKNEGFKATVEELCETSEKLERLQQENDRLKFWLNDVIFDDNNNDVELPARYLKKLGYIDFDDEKQVYTNKHNNEPFLQKEYKEKAFNLKDDELDDYTKQLEYKFKKVIEYCDNNMEFTPRLIDVKEILNGGSDE